MARLSLDGRANPSEKRVKRVRQRKCHAIEPRATTLSAKSAGPSRKGLASCREQSLAIVGLRQIEPRGSSMKIYIIQRETGLDGDFVQRILSTKERSRLG